MWLSMLGEGLICGEVGKMKLDRNVIPAPKVRARQQTFGGTAPSIKTSAQETLSSF